MRDAGPRAHTAEANIPRGKGYLPLEDLVTKYQALGDIRTEMAIVDANTVTLRDYRLSLIRSADAKQYQAALVPLKGCATAWFTSERGLIYTGKTLDCPADSTN